MKKIFFLFIILSFLSGCQSAKDAFTLKKKSSSDEFLVEKKSPLVIPPNYGELPLPSDQSVIKNKDNDVEMTVILGGEKLKIDETIKNSKPSSLEESILKKIK